MVIICPSPLTYARQRPITASHSSRYDMLAIISSRYQYGPFLFFLLQKLCQITWLLTDWKIFSTSGGPLRPDARGICHICHMVNPALLPHTSALCSLSVAHVVTFVSCGISQFIVFAYAIIVAQKTTTRPVIIIIIRASWRQQSISDHQSAGGDLWQKSHRPTVGYRCLSVLRSYSIWRQMTK